jgi:hypothetical protein
MTARGPIVPGVHSASPRAPLRCSSGHCASRAGPLRGPRGRSAADLTGTTMNMQPALTSATRSEDLGTILAGLERASRARLAAEYFRRYPELGSVRLLKQNLHEQRIRSKQRTYRNGSRVGGQPFSRGALCALLSNPVYIGEIAHKGARYPGQHEAILDRETWDSVQGADRATHRSATDGRGCGVATDVRGNPIADRPAAGSAPA